MSDSKVLISEVGPRDGLQSIKSVMPTAAKLRWISALAAAGLREIEVGSFVPPKLLPQMADIREVVAHALSIPGLRVAVLAPNLRGCQKAFEAGVHKVTLPVSVTNEHAMANIRKTTAQLIDDVREIVALRDAQYPSIEIEAGVSVAFGCTIAGTVTDDQTMRMCQSMADCGVDEIGLSDTSGYANPTQVRRLFRRLQSEFGNKAGGAHFHNTRGQGLANVVAALDVGVTTIDASQAGLGGCPYAPGATGNIVTEDLVFLLEAMGYDTGIDVDALVAARSILAEALPGEALYGHVQDAGLPKGFTYADGRAPSAPQPEGCLLGVAQ
ncbi:hydroxymethylglutaryl-CoA lyase [Paraburkholderia sp. CNPSo 3157]|uniref:Hydroxymethylglutaryl-CoA lyase n=1 Tax=Paraburkholderia franconis TaxID=2654983 RepID=A0A7X1TIK6_9BURK|nr:hydroxymethylglutaryl-CoA lyase [Paraburkholderia franconis]MPW20486.1 hydroxymethylglutaryl-CoA lyase [Paraburkholderia franconis]